MKIITILLLMIGWTEAALGEAAGWYTTDQCERMRSISEDAIHHSINSDSMAAVINRLQGDFPKGLLAANKELIGGIYKTVDQFKTKSGQIREQDKEKIKDELGDVVFAKFWKCFDKSMIDQDNAGACGESGC